MHACMCVCVCVFVHVCVYLPLGVKVYMHALTNMHVCVEHLCQLILYYKRTKGQQACHIRLYVMLAAAPLIIFGYCQ